MDVAMTVVVVEAVVAVRTSSVMSVVSLAILPVNAAYAWAHVG